MTAWILYCAGLCLLAMMCAASPRSVASLAALEWH